MRGIALQPVPVKVSAEEPLTKFDRLRRVRAIEAMRLPGLLARLNNDCRQLLTELIGMNLKPTVRSLLERKGKGGKFLRSPEPHETAFAHVDIGFEDLSEAPPCSAVHPVSGDDEIRIGKLGVARYFTLEA